MKETAPTIGDSERIASRRGSAEPPACRGVAPPLAWLLATGWRWPSTETVAATPELLDLVDAVNRYVNRTILPVTDKDHWGVIDRWGFPVDAMGDCEDIQLLKRRSLIAAGVPRRALPMTVVLDEAGEGHAVLTVRTHGEDLILDNKTSDVKSWDRTAYTYVKREGETRTGWVFLEAKPMPVITAAAQ